MSRRARTKTRSSRWCARRATRRGFGPKRTRSQSPCSHALPCSPPRTPPRSSRHPCSGPARRGSRTTTTRCMNSNCSKDVCRPRQSSLRTGDPSEGRLVARAATAVAEVAGWAVVACWAVKEAQEVVREAREVKGALGSAVAVWVGVAATVATKVVWATKEASEALASHRSSRPRTGQTQCSCWMSIRGPSIWRLASRRRTSP